MFLYSSFAISMEVANEGVEFEVLKADLNATPWDGEILLIIDMQKSFPAAHSECLQTNIGAMIEAAIARKQLIVFLEYGQDDKTLPALSNIAKEYGRKITLYKNRRSGCAEINDFLNKLGTRNHLFYVCGVDTQACVYETATDLCECEFGHRVRVISNCCGSAQPEGHEEAIELFKARMKELKNLEIDSGQGEIENLKNPKVDKNKKRATPRVRHCNIL